MQPAQSLTRSTRFLRAALGALWFTLLPACLALVVVRYALPSPLAAGSSLERAFANAGVESPLSVGIGLFLVFALLAHYWRFSLPGGRYLSTLPVTLAQRLKRSELEEFASAHELARRLGRKSLRARLALTLSPQQRERLERSRDALRAAVKSADVHALRVAQHDVFTLSRDARRSLELSALLPFALLLGAALAGALILRGFALQSYRVLSGSMLPSLVPGELALSNQLAYHTPFGAARLPKRGDIVVFRRGVKDTDDLVKRVIGLPGDHISVANGYPIINGWPVPYCDAGRYAEVLADSNIDGRVALEFLGDAAYLTLHTALAKPADDYDVPAGEVFVLGDNRNESLDSRFFDAGKPQGLPLVNIEGRLARSVSLPRRDQTPSFAGFFAPIGNEISIPGVNVQSLKTGIERCLAKRPRQTNPPARDTEP